MTLITGIRCPDGVVLCANTQETAGYYRSSRDKVEQKLMGQFAVVIAGSGLSELIDSFVERMVRRMATELSSSLIDFQHIFETELELFKRDEVSTFSASEEDKYLGFLVAAVSSEGYEVWVTKDQRLIRIDAYEVVGWEIPLYTHVLRKFFREQISVSQGVLAALYMLTVAENTSNYVKGPFSVAIVRQNGIFIEDQAYIREMADRLRAYDSYVNAILLSCADTGMSMVRLERELVTFAESVRDLHKAHVTEVVRTMLKAGLNTINDPYARVPAGLTLAIAAGDLETLTPREREAFLKKAGEIVQNIPKTEGQATPEPPTRDPKGQPPSQE